MANESVSKTITVAVTLCVVCAIVVSSAAVFLRSAQEKNKLLDLKANILASAGLLKTGIGIEKQFEAISARVIDLETGQYADHIDPSVYDQRKSSKDPEMSKSLTPSEDIAKIKRRVRYATVYLSEVDGKIDKLILPVSGYGLWSTLHGFIALESDFSSVAGIGFYEHAETPGLGGEVDNPVWKASWIGKKAYDGDSVKIEVIKGRVNKDLPEALYQIDGLAGATLTTRGVDNLVKYWLGDNGFAPFIRSLKIGDELYVQN
ncbi:Na(+)-translocating NADH-quinone reductase subunit C [Gammaproteobacteria bacterium]|nr:Na(+)-translocating NADH-quinone reductase subunit C [Gammaproteobacteria bacterium]